MKSEKPDWHVKLDQFAKDWHEGRGELLSDGSLWQAYRYQQSKTAKHLGFSPITADFINQSMQKNGDDVLYAERLEGRCADCRFEHLTVYMMMCKKCQREFCKSCIKRFTVNGVGDKVCQCGGLLI